MLRSMSSAISGMQAFQTDLDVVGNNIANVNTIGFKSSRTDFSDVLSQTSQGGNPASTTGLGGTNPMQVGLGVKASDIELDMSQGPDQTTGNPTDLAVNGGGFFIVSPDATDQASGVTNGGYHSLYSRAGNFTVDSSNNLVLPDGYVGMGYPVKQDQSINSTGTSLQKLNLSDLWTRFQATGGATTTVSLSKNPDAQIGNNGAISVTASDGKRYTIGFVGLATVPNPAGLEKQGDNLFAATTASGGVTTGQPGDQTLNLGTLSSGMLEQSNVDLAHEFSEMIVAQNGFTANSHMIGTDNQVLQALVSMKNS